MLFTILFVVALVAAISFMVIKVQKNKAKQCPCPVHHDEESVVGYETAAPAPSPVVKKKAAKNKPAAKKPNSSQKKK